MGYNIFEEEAEVKVQEMEIFLKVQKVLLYLICGFGAPANMITFVILCRPQMKSPMNCCLRFLTVFDALYLLSSLFVVNDVAKTYFSMLLYIGLLGSVWTVVLVSLERFIAVCHPLKARSLCTYRRTVVCCLVITVSSICINVPRLFLMGNGKFIGGQADIIVYYVMRFGPQEWLNLTKREIYILKSYGWLEVAVVFCIPLVLLCFFNIYIYKAVKMSAKARREMTQTQKTEVKLSMTVIAIVIVFFTCGIPTLIFKCACYGGIIRLHIFGKIFVFVDPIISVNSAANFAIYFAQRPDFRGIIFETFSRFCCKRRQKSEVNIVENTRL